MKYISYSAIALAALAFTACESDRDDNPTYIGANNVEFHLNVPAYSSIAVDLASTDSLLLTWNQPAWGFPVAADYTLQVSPTDNYNVSYTEQQNDETGALKADYYEIDAVKGLSANYGARNINRGIVAINGWASEEDVPAETEVYLRLKAVATASQAQEAVYSNSIKLSVIPTYVALKDADPAPWFLIGTCIADGAWTIDGPLGKSTYPMGIVSGEKYNANTGAGNFTWSGYLTDGGFKIISNTPSSSNWSETDQWGMSDGAFVFNDGGSGNIVVEANGYYTVSLNTENGSDPVITKMEAEPKVYESLAAAGDFNGWNTTDDLLTPISTAACLEGHNHMWSFEIEGPTTLKILTPGEWSTNWGSSDFPIGVGTNGGANIPVAEGKWLFIFNDIDGCYYFKAL